jgi:Uma2 family endonuclease
MSSARKRNLTEEEYLAIERAASNRSIFYRGEMFAMTGAKETHVLVTGNLLANIWNQFEDRPCRVYASDMRVKNVRTGSYFYPDIAALCHDPELADSHGDTLTNPQVVIEVLSKSTESFDRGGKFEDYQLLDSLQEYVLVAQDKPRVELYRRQQDGSWNYVSLSQLSDVLKLGSVDVQIALSQIYAKVDFKPESDPEDSADLNVIEEKATYQA